MKIIIGLRILKFAITGGIATAIHLFIAWCLCQTTNWTLLTINATSFFGAFIVSYLLQSKWTFQKKATDLNQLIRFSVIALGGFLGSQLTISITQNYYPLPPAVTLTTAILAIPIITFILHNLWVFKSE